MMFHEISCKTAANVHDVHELQLLMMPKRHLQQLCVCIDTIFISGGTLLIEGVWLQNMEEGNVNFCPFMNAFVFFI